MRRCTLSVPIGAGLARIATSASGNGSWSGRDSMPCPYVFREADRYLTS